MRTWMMLVVPLVVGCGSEDDKAEESETPEPCGDGFARADNGNCYPISTESDADTDTDTDTDADMGICAEATSCSGGHQIENEAQLADLYLCNTMNDLIIEYQSWLTSIDLPCLTSVTGDDHDYLWIEGNNSLTTINMPKLSTVSGLRILSNISLTHLELPKVESVWSIVVEDNSALVSIDMPNLTTVQGDTRYIRMIIRNNPVLTNFEMHSLETSNGTVNFEDKSALTSIDLPSLNSVGASFRINDNFALTSVELPSLFSVPSWFDIIGNSELTSLSGISRDLTVDKLQIKYNDSLCQTHAEAFAESIEVTGSTSILGNDGDCD